MIKCPNCEADNLLGAIFCRGCGKKLDIDNLKPDQLESKPKKVAKSAAHIVRNIIMLVVLVVVIGGIALALLPPKISATGELADAASATAMTKMGNLQEGRAREAEVTEDEITYAARRILKLTEDDKSALAKKNAEEGITQNVLADDVFVSLPQPGEVHVILKERLFDAVTIFYTMIVSVSEGEEGIVLTPTGYKVGRLPMAGPMNDIVRDRFVAAAHAETNYSKWEEGIFKTAKKAEIEPGKVKISR